MLKYLNTQVVFAEIPDEITLAVNITNCPHKCKECHSSYLQQDIGTELTEKEIDALIKNNPHITVICFMGGDRSHDDIIKCAAYIRLKYKIKIGMYSGDSDIDLELAKVLDFYKVGPYIKEKGPLNKRTTNQILYKIENMHMRNITYKFWNTTL